MKELLDKYKILISDILKCKPEEIKFFSEQIINEGLDNEKKEFIEIGELFYYKPNEEGYTEQTRQANWNLGSYKIKQVIGENLNEISSWKLYQLPHCCAYMVSCNVYIEEEYRKKGIGTILNQLRIEIGKHLNYSSILCTDVKQNKGQRAILAKNGWEDIHSIKNKRTRNLVYLSVINI